MNSLFSKCYPLSRKTFSNVFKKIPIKNFTTNTVNTLANLNCSFVTTPEVSYQDIYIINSNLNSLRIRRLSQNLLRKMWIIL